MAKAKALIGRWGKNLGIRFPAEIEKAMELRPGEEVEFERKGPDLVMRRPNARAHSRARKAAAEIIRESHKYTLGGLSIRELIGRDDH
jgi:antitoxin component of MazEF toxin-antitoxin module